MIAPPPSGSDFIVNTKAIGDQSSPALAKLADGRFVATWMDQNGDGSGSAIRGRIMNADGTAASGDFIVNTTTEMNQLSPKVAALADGRFVVVWQDESAGTSGNNIRARIMKADGTESPLDLVVNSSAFDTLSEPAVTALPDGRILVAWRAEGVADKSGSAIVARIIASDGSASTAEFIVNSITVCNQVAPGLAALTGGRFVAVWQDNNGDGSGSAIRARIMSADGTAIAEDLLVNTTTAADQLRPSVTLLADGRFVVTWHEGVVDGAPSTIRARIMNSDGSAAASDFVVNSTSAGVHSTPSVTGLSDGRFVVLWTATDGGDGSGSAIRGRLFGADGTADGPDSVVNSTTAGNQSAPHAAALADGRYVATWVSLDGGDGSGSAIRASIIQPTPVLSAAADTLSGEEDKVLVIRAAELLANDTGAVAVTAVSSAVHGSVRLDDRGTASGDDDLIIFTPAANHHGSAGFSYSAADAAGRTATASVTIAVAPVNDAPVARADSYATVEDTPLTIDARSGLLANDTDVDGDALTVVLASGPARGSLALAADGSFVYTPFAGASGPDSFTYTATDPHGAVSSATVTIAVAPVNDAPFARADSYAATENRSLVIAAGAGVLANDRDPDGDRLSAGLKSGPTFGTLSLAADGSFVYTPRGGYTGRDSFVYLASDGYGGVTEATATLFVTRSGSDALVNSTTSGNQDRPSVAALGGGRHVVTWTSKDGQGADASGTAIRARIFDADGRPAGEDFVVASTTRGDQSASAVAGLPDGRLMIVWQSDDRQGGDASFSGIRGRIYTAEGRPIGDDFVINTATDGFQERPSIAVLPDGRMLVTWQSFDGQGSDTALSGIRGRLFGADGRAVGDDFVVNSATAGLQLAPRSVALTDGRFLVAWESFDGQGEDRSGSAIRGRLFSADGTAIGSDFVLNGVTAADQLAPALAALPGGRFIAVWQSGDAEGTDRSATAVRARIYGADGQPLGNDFVVNSSSTGRQDLPTVAALADGRFLVTWSSGDGQGADRSASGIRGRLFNPDGTPDGDDFVLNTSTRDTQASPFVIALANGRFVVAWQSFDGEGEDISGSGIRSRSLALDPFDGWSYLASHDDLLRAFGSREAAAPEHYAIYGFKEGRARDGFDEWSYIASHGDLIRAFGSNGAAATEHFVRYGFREGRVRDSFDEWSYLASHSDLMRAYGPNGSAAAGHFVHYGAGEGRARDGFAEWSYLASHPDLILAFKGNGAAGPEHYVRHGFAEGRSKDSFDELRYIASHRDLIAAFGADGEAGARHYATYGYNEGRSTSAFDPAHYLSRYADLRAAFGSDTAAATEHYIRYGAAEGRTDSFFL